MLIGGPCWVSFCGSSVSSLAFFLLLSSLPILAKDFDWLSCSVQSLTSVSLWFYRSQHVHVSSACRKYSACPNFHCLSYFHFSISHQKFNFAVLRYIHFRIQVEWMPYGCWYSPLIVQMGFAQFSKLPMFHLIPQTKSFVHGLFFPAVEQVQHWEQLVQGLRHRVLLVSRALSQRFTIPIVSSGAFSNLHHCW